MDARKKKPKISGIPVISLTSEQKEVHDAAIAFVQKSDDGYLTIGGLVSRRFDSRGSQPTGTLSPAGIEAKGV